MEKKCTKCGVVKSLDEFSNDKNGEYGKAWKCKSCFKEYKKNWAKEWYKNNKEKQRLINAKYHKDNKEKIRKRANVWAKKKKKTDVLYKLKCTVRVNLATSLKRQGYTKKTKTYNMLKCEYTFFMEWLNGLASNGYTYGIGNLHLDHVVPISLAETEEEILLLCHYSNYQLLSAKENIVKGNRYVNPVNLARVLEHHPNPDKIRKIHARL